MRFSTQILATVASVLALVSADCYEGGQDGHKGTELDKINGIETACLSLSGAYQSGERRRTCVQDSAGTKWDFELHVR